jgi:hypothetical protein
MRVRVGLDDVIQPEELRHVQPWEADGGRRLREAVMDFACRGSWVLGTACGHCPRCQDEARALIPKLLTQRKELEAKLTMIAMVLPPIFEQGDYTDAYKIVAFDEARRVFYRKEK